ncbi:HdeD family acid-resistance protein [Propionicimonas sp. T2.31MG-18]|uniref:HdeD family acid-resistance protein n=1 Tax=Propionicimonas sp. T2.31MG-18 TaxID=3157620 RepID=UPI00366BB6C6
MINAIRAALGVGGLVSLVIGVVILAWPGKTAMVIAGIIAVYAAIAGLVNLGIGLFSRRIGGWPRVGYLVLGAVFLVASAVAFANLGIAAAVLASLVGVLVGVVWIIEGVVGLTLIGDAASKVWTVIFAIISILAGVTLLTSPLWGAAFLWWLLGISLVILGLVQIVRAFRFGPR